MKKIKLLTISATCERGGSDINLLRILKNLDKNEYEILHLIPYLGPLIDEFKNAGVGVKVMDMPRIRLFKNPLKYIMFIFKFFSAVFKIKNIIDNYRIDIVCTSSMVNLYGALATRLAHRPHILLAGEYLPIMRLLSPYFYFLSDRIVCCSNTVSQMFKKSDKVLVRYHGIDLDEFNPQINGQSLRKELTVSVSLVSMITRFAQWKGLEVFIKAASYIKEEVKFIVFGQEVVGRESYVAKLKKLIIQLGLKDKVFIVSGQHKNVPQIISASDVIVHASLRPEPFGLVIIEAMAEGKPVVASKRGGPLEIISDGADGMLVEPGDPKVLAKAISLLLENPKLAKEMGKRAREKVVKKFDLGEYARRLDTLFKETLKAYSLRQARASIGKETWVRILKPLAKLLIPLPSKITDINKDSIKKILVIQLFGIGDLICSTVLLEALKRYFNQSKITLLMDTKLIDLANLIDCVDETVGYQRGVLSKFRLIAKIKRDKFDMAVVLNPLFQGAGIAYLSQAKYRLGYTRDYEGMQDIGKLRRLLTHSIAIINQPLHDIQRYMGIARFLGIDLSLSLPQLNISDTAREWADDFLRDNGITEKDFILGINPHAVWEAKCWDMDRFANVADSTIERCNAKVIFFGSSAPTDMDRIDTIRSSMRYKAISTAGKTDIPRLAALLKRCSVFLTNDSGPMHLAGALGVNTVALFGPSDINKFGYKRENIINLSADGLFCKPCLLNYRYKDNCSDNACIKGIGISEVIKAVEILMNNKKDER